MYEGSHANRIRKKMMMTLRKTYVRKLDGPEQSRLFSFKAVSSGYFSPLLVPNEV